MFLKISSVLLLAFVVTAHCDVENILPRVIGGTPAVVGQAPSVVSIRVPLQVGATTQTYCTGTIVNVNHVVTSCLCVQTSTFLLVNPFWFTITAGDLNIVSPSYGRFTTNATHIYTHPAYTFTPRANDIAVMRTSQPFPFPHNTIDFAVRNIRPLTTGHNCRFTGWGVNAPGAELVQPLQQVLPANILDRALCNAAGVHPGIQDNMICAGILGANSGVCMGGQGGPLFCNVDGWWEFTGVLTLGLGCGVQNTPGVYMQVREFNAWIDQQFTRTDRTEPGTQLIAPP
jgi:secreted trypsin-like serine protease